MNKRLVGNGQETAAKATRTVSSSLPGGDASSPRRGFGPGKAELLSGTPCRQCKKLGCRGAEPGRGERGEGSCLIRHMLGLSRKDRTHNFGFKILC